MSDTARAARALARRTGDTAPAEPPATVAEVIAAVRAYFDGVPADFTAVALDPGPQEAFPAAVYHHVRRIPWGETTTYGAVARALDAGPDAARDVGQAMARNPLPLLVPCHRVLAAGGRPANSRRRAEPRRSSACWRSKGYDLAPAQAAFGSDRDPRGLLRTPSRPPWCASARDALAVRGGWFYSTGQFQAVPVPPMPKINGNEIRPGNIIEHDGGLWVAVKTNHVKPGKGGAFAQVEMKNLLNGRKLNERFRSADKVERVRLEQKDLRSSTRATAC